MLRTRGVAGGAPTRRRPPVLQPRLRLRLHPLARGDALLLAGGGPGRGRRAGHPPLPAAGAGRRLPAARRPPATASTRPPGSSRRRRSAPPATRTPSPSSPPRGCPRGSRALFYREAWFDPQAATLTLPTGGIDPLTGRSIYQLAMAGTQSAPLAEHGPAAGPRAPPGAPDAHRRRRGRRRRRALRRPRHLARRHRRAAAGGARSTGRRGGARGGRGGGQASGARAPRPRAAGGGRRPGGGRARGGASGAGGRPSRRRPRRGGGAGAAREKVAAAQEALAAIAGLVFDATSPAETVVPGERAAGRADVSSTAARSRSSWRDPAAHALGLTAESVGLPLAAERGAGRGATAAAAGPSPRRRPASAKVDAAGRRRCPRRRALLPAQPTPAGTTTSRASRRSCRASRSARSRSRPRSADRWCPTRRSAARRQLPLSLRPRPVVAAPRRHRPRRGAPAAARVPALEVAVAPELLVWPLGDQAPRPLAVEPRPAPRRAAGRPARGERPPQAGRRPPPVPFTSPPQGTAEVPLPSRRRPRAGAAAGAPIGVTRGSTTARRFALALPLVDYPHIHRRPLPEPAQAAVTAPVARAAARSRGSATCAAPPTGCRSRCASDRSAGRGARRPASCRRGDLSRFDAIVVGWRAYDVEPAAAPGQRRGCSTTRAAGGLLIVQSQRVRLLRRSGLTPLPMEMRASQHGRTTDETAPVTRSGAGSPALTTPNRIGPADWQGWVQERGVYYPTTWDSGLPAAAGDGRSWPSRSCAARCWSRRSGAGYYVYTGLAFFRQLPAGVPAAPSACSPTCWRCPTARGGGSGGR